jgi:hypothetical protein
MEYQVIYFLIPTTHIWLLLQINISLMANQNTYVRQIVFGGKQVRDSVKIMRITFHGLYFLL